MTAAALVVVALVVGHAPLSHIAAGLAMLLGFSSHLAIDAVNPTPQMLWWPLSRRRVRPWSGLSQYSAGGKLMELAVGLLAVLAVLHWAVEPAVALGGGLHV